MGRTKNASKNLLFGTIYRFILLLAPFAVRTVMIKTLGVEYVGLGSLFSSILNVLNLAELGLNSAIVFTMYGAIATNDKQQIKQLMSFYRKTYRIIGIIVLAGGCIVAPFLDYFISGDVPADINKYIVYFMMLISTSLTYFLFAYKTCLFTAHQRSDVPSKIGSVITLALNVTQCILLLLFKNYYFYLIVIPVSTIANNLILALLCSKKYPEYKPDGELPPEIKKSIKKKVSSLFVYKLGSIVLSSVDAIVISTFLGLTILGKYNNYYYIITALFGFFEVYYNSMTAGIGNSIKLESKQKNKKDFNRLFMIQGWIVTWCSTCLFCLYQPFMRIWVGESLMFPIFVPICLTILFFVWKMMDVVNVYKNAAGLWEFDKWRPLIAAIFNLAINLVLVQFIGIYGIIISTIASIIIIIFPWSTFVLFKHFFNEGNYKKAFLEYTLKLFKFLIVSTSTVVSTYFICTLIPDLSIWHLLFKAAICIVFPNIILLCVFPFFHDFAETKEWIFLRIREAIKK